MDPMQQVELRRDLMMIQAKTNPKPINGRLYNSHALLPLFIVILLVSYFLPGLRRYFCPVGISCAELVGLLANKKGALFLFSNFIFILLVVDFTLSSPSNSFTSALHNDNSASLRGHLRPSVSNGAILVGDAPAVAEQLHDDSLRISSSLEAEQVISLEQKSTISVDYSFAEEAKLAKEESKTNIDIFGDFLTSEIGDHIVEWRPEYSNKSQQGRRRMKTAERGGHIPTLEVVVQVEDDAIGKERTELEAFGMEDELEHLELDELNRKFDEFIATKKNKWRSEALAAASHGRLISLNFEIDGACGLPRRSAYQIRN